MNTTDFSTSLRIGLATCTSLLMTFVILVFMKSLIGGDGPVILNKKKTIPLPEFIFSKPDEPDPLIDRIEPPEKYVEPLPDPLIPHTGETGEKLLVGMERIPPIDNNGDDIVFRPQFNTELAAIVDIQPEYPQWAVRKGIEGYVLVEFTVTRSGSTEDIEVIDAYPEDTFNRSAIRAASKSRFKPKIVNGSPVPVKGMQKKYTFRIDE